MKWEIFVFVAYVTLLITVPVILILGIKCLTFIQVSWIKWKNRNNTRKEVVEVCVRYHNMCAINPHDKVEIIEEGTDFKGRESNVFCIIHPKDVKKLIKRGYYDQKHFGLYGFYYFNRR